MKQTLSFLIGMAINLANQFPFMSSQESSPYRVDLSPASITKEWWAYSNEALNYLLLVAILLALSGAACWLRSRIQRPWAGICLAVAGLLALLPNSLLPNHHDGYSIVGAYMLFAPVLLIGQLWVYSGRRGKVLAFVIALVAFSSPLLWKSEYRAKDWSLAQGVIQRNLLSGLRGAGRQLAGDQSTRILVTGISFPFSPFEIQYVPIKSLTGNAPVQLDVLHYKPRGVQSPVPDKIRHVAVNNLRFDAYDEVWSFRSDGTLAQIIKSPALTALDSERGAGFKTSDLILYPDLQKNFGEPFGEVSNNDPDGYELLQCGNTLLSYENLKGAEICLRQSVSLIKENPHPHYSLGLVLEKQGNITEAAGFFRAAIAHDDKKAPQPAFTEALNRVTATPTSSPSR